MAPAVSLCMIAKNEEFNLPACLGSVRDLVSEMIVVDTGSTDRTKETAALLGARVYDFAWCDDFAAARNASLQPATGEWIFWLDGDERLDEPNRQRFRQVLAGLRDENAAYVMAQRSTSDPTSGEASIFTQVRLFRNLPHIRWRYRVHEQILPALEESGAAIRWTDVTIEHAGYEDPALYRGKQERNFRLLLLQQQETPDDPLTLFNLGLTHYTLGRHGDAMAFWRRSLELSPPTLSLVRKLYALLAKGHLQAGESHQSLATARAGLERYPDDVELLSITAGLLAESGDLRGAEQSLRRILDSSTTDYFAASLDTGLRSYKARHHLARIHRAQLRDQDAEAEWRLALSERPDFAPALVDLGALYLDQKRWDDLGGVVSKLEGCGRGGEQAVLLRASAHMTRNELGAARQILEHGIKQFTDSLDLHRTLSRVVLRQGNDPTAAETELRRVLTLDPLHLEARNNLTVLLRQQGRQHEPIDSQLAEKLFALADDALHAGKHDDAAARFRPLLHANYRAGLVLFKLATIANHQGDFQGAWELHRQAVAVDPSLAAKIAPPDSAHRNYLCRATYDIVPVDRCPVCGNADQAPMMVVNCLPFPHCHPSIDPVRHWVRCGACGHGFANPRPGPEALSEAYRDPAPGHLAKWSYDRLTLWSDIVHDLWLRKPQGDLLDIGSGHGGLAGVAMDYGYRATAIDIHPAYEDMVRRLGAEFLLGDVGHL